mmetsp:Transcript_44653/g.100583  ORF Transcript_44653/g.100583 Transcript_44653/m.100583 type:complete len:311 (+) Transcript_44653:603-1535(+)
MGASCLGTSAPCIAATPSGCKWMATCVECCACEAFRPAPFLRFFLGGGAPAKMLASGLSATYGVTGCVAIKPRTYCFCQSLGIAANTSSWSSDLHTSAPTAICKCEGVSELLVAYFSSASLSSSASSSATLVKVFFRTRMSKAERFQTFVTSGKAANFSRPRRASSIDAVKSKSHTASSTSLILKPSPGLFGFFFLFGGATSSVPKASAGESSGAFAMMLSRSAVSSSLRASSACLRRVTILLWRACELPEPQAVRSMLTRRPRNSDLCSSKASCTSSSSSNWANAIPLDLPVALSVRSLTVTLPLTPDV